MSTQLVDLSFVYTMSDNDTTYVYEVVALFLENIPKALVKLEQLIQNTDDFEAIQKQAHMLKSSANVIKVRGMFDDLVQMESLARQGHHKDTTAEKKAENKEKITELLEHILGNFNEALPLLMEEKEKNKPGKSKGKK